MAASHSSLTRMASTCAPETADGTHLFKIKGYSLFRGFSVGKFIRSATFAVGRYEWYVRFYPDGETEASKDWVAVDLVLNTDNTEVRALFHIWMVDQATQPLAPGPNPKRTEPVVFDCRDNAGHCWGSTYFLRKSELEGYIMDDILLIECYLTVIKFKEAQVVDAKMNAEVQVQPSDLLENLNKLLLATEGADVSFKVKREVFPAHKIILAMQLPVFMAEFYGPLKEEQRHIITVADMQPTSFKGLLHFIYKDSFPPLDDLNSDEYEEMLRHLLVAADMYGMERMKLMCESKLCEVLSTETAATTLISSSRPTSFQQAQTCLH